MGEGGGGRRRATYRPPLAGVWWDLNTCPVPDDFDPRCVRGCINSALQKQIRFPTVNAIYAIGNLEYISSDILEKIESSGIMLIHAPCGGNSLTSFLYEWCDLVQHEDPQLAGSGYIMLISGNSTMVNRCALDKFSRFNKLCAYPRDVGQVTTLDDHGEKVFVKEFVWEALLSDNASPCNPAWLEVGPEDETGGCHCEVCCVICETCNDFITHLKSEQHREELFGIAALDYDKPRYFCAVCNYPAYDEFNLSLHNESEDHNQKLAASSSSSRGLREQEEKSTRSNLLNEPKEEDIVA